MQIKAEYQLSDDQAEDLVSQFRLFQLRLYKRLFVLRKCGDSPILPSFIRLVLIGQIYRFQAHKYLAAYRQVQEKSLFLVSLFLLYGLIVVQPFIHLF